MRVGMGVVIMMLRRRMRMGIMIFVIFMIMTMMMMGSRGSGRGAGGPPRARRLRARYGGVPGRPHLGRQRQVRSPTPENDSKMRIPGDKYAINQSLALPI
jgi:hypothetical protein